MRSRDFPNTANPLKPTAPRHCCGECAEKLPTPSARLNAIPASAGETRAEALYYVAQTLRAHEAMGTGARHRRRVAAQFSNSPFTPRALVSVGQIAEDANNDADASYFLRTAVTVIRSSIEVAQAQFDLAWMAHEDRNFAESSKLLTEHLAYYADKNTDNRGRAGYWAARDSERAGKLAEARALYKAMLGRYDANWYGYLAKQRLDAMLRSGVGTVPPKTFAADSVVGRAVANLQTVTVAEETAGANEDKIIAKADELNNVGLNDWALEELAVAAAAAGNSPKVNLAIARVYRSEEDNVRALNVLKKSFPDYSQMKPEEMTREEWDVFYPLVLLGHHCAGVAREEPRSVSGGRIDSSGNGFHVARAFVGASLWTDAVAGSDRRVDGEEVWR